MAAARQVRPPKPSRQAHCPVNCGGERVSERDSPAHPPAAGAPARTQAPQSDPGRPAAGARIRACQGREPQGGTFRGSPGAWGPARSVPGCTGGRGSCAGRRHRARSPGRWPASSGGGHIGHTWGPPRGADTRSAQSPRHTARPAGRPGHCSHSLHRRGAAELGAGHPNLCPPPPRGHASGRRTRRGRSPAENLESQAATLSLQSQHLATWPAARLPRTGSVPLPSQACRRLLAQRPGTPRMGSRAGPRAAAAPHGRLGPSTHGGSPAGWRR